MIQGDLNVRRTGAIDGWCWDTARPAARLAVELLVDGALVATVAADAARRDLQRRGIGDGRHAFNVTVNAALLAGGERLVSARDSLSRVVFGQYHVGAAEPPPPDPTLDALEDELREMSGGLGRLMALRGAEPGHSGVLRQEFSTLATVLRTPGVRAAEPAIRQLAAARAVLARQVGPNSVALREPAIALLLLDATLADALAWARTVSGDGGRHELLVPDLGTTPQVALLPSLVPALRTWPMPGAGLAATAAAAASIARSPVMAVVGSPASLVALDEAVAGIGDAIVLGAAASLRAHTLGAGRGWDVRHAVAATGLLVAAAPAVLGGLDPALDHDPVAAVLDLAMRNPARRRVTLVEPWQP